jgi:hypothetical protein
LGENRKFRTGLRRVSAIAVLFSHRQKLLERGFERPLAAVYATGRSPSMAPLSKQARAAALIIVQR